MHLTGLKDLHAAIIPIGAVVPPLEGTRLKVPHHVCTGSVTRLLCPPSGLYWVCDPPEGSPSGLYWVCDPSAAGAAGHWLSRLRRWLALASAGLQSGLYVGESECHRGSFN